MKNNIEVWLQSASQPIVRNNVETYTKDGMYCIYNRNDNFVEKFPLVNIYKVKEISC